MIIAPPDNLKYKAGDIVVYKDIYKFSCYDKEWITDKKVGKIINFLNYHYVIRSNFPAGPRDEDWIPPSRVMRLATDKESNLFTRTRQFDL